MYTRETAFTAFAESRVCWLYAAIWYPPRVFLHEDSDVIILARDTLLHDDPVASKKIRVTLVALRARRRCGPVGPTIAFAVRLRARALACRLDRRKEGPLPRSLLVSQVVRQNRRPLTHERARARVHLACAWSTTCLDTNPYVRTRTHEMCVTLHNRLAAAAVPARL